MSVISNCKDYFNNLTGKLVTVFEYEKRFESYLGKSTEIEITEKGKPESIPSGDASTGSYTISYFTPLPLQENCIGIHFGYGDFGIFYPPKDLMNHVVYLKVTASEFLDKIFEEFNVKLSGFDIMPGSMGAKLIEGGSKR